MTIKCFCSPLCPQSPLPHCPDKTLQLTSPFLCPAEVAGPGHAPHLPLCPAGKQEAVRGPAQPGAACKRCPRLWGRDRKPWARCPPAVGRLRKPLGPGRAALHRPLISGRSGAAPRCSLSPAPPRPPLAGESALTGTSRRTGGGE